MVNINKKLRYYNRVLLCLEQEMGNAEKTAEQEMVDAEKTVDDVSLILSITTYIDKKIIWSMIRS